FFFSSRRRHTRFSRDWSSDVCSSDLAGGAVLDALAGAPWGSALSPCEINVLRRWARLSARCSRAPEPAVPDGDGPLSPRELQVLDRKSVVEGKSVGRGGRRISK